MCTVSWAPTSDGFVLLMNRDERRNRAPAESPRIVDVGEAQAIAPRDGEAGGTWIGVNSHGLAIALANLYPSPPPPVPQSRISRGLLVQDALRFRDLDALKEGFGSADLTKYEPFQLMAFAPNPPGYSLVWDGRVRYGVTHTEPGLITTSSSRDQEGADRIRTALFARAAESAGEVNLELLEELHRSREPEPGPYAVSMERSDAATLSLSSIRVSADNVSFSYTPGPPHRTAADPPLSLPRLVPHPAAADPTSHLVDP